MTQRVPKGAKRASKELQNDSKIEPKALPKPFKLVGTGAQNPDRYHQLGLFLGSWIPTRPWPVAWGLGPWPGSIYWQGVIPDSTLPGTLEKNFVKDLASKSSKLVET